MIEQNIDILSYQVFTSADAVCFTSNGIIKKDGCLVMGAGNAKAFRDKFPGIDQSSGHNVKKYGNICQIVLCGQPNIVAFPTKHHWKDKSDIQLIERSTQQLLTLANNYKWNKIYLPFPGCNNGQLNKNDVRPVLQKYLDDRFIVTVI